MTDADAAAVTDVPALRAEVERLRAENRELALHVQVSALVARARASEDALAELLAERTAECDEWKREALGKRAALDALSARLQAESGVAVLLAALSEWVDECGEVIQAYIGATGQNPRKGVTKSMGDVGKELLDVAVTALTAYEHLNQNVGTSWGALAAHVRFLCDRAGIVLDASLGTPGDEKPQPSVVVHQPDGVARIVQPEKGEVPEGVEFTFPPCKVCGAESVCGHEREAVPVPKPQATTAMVECATCYGSLAVRVVREPTE